MARVTSEFGGRVSPITGKWEGHSGIDFATPIGTPIYASKPLQVVQTGYQLDPKTGKGWGNYALVEDPQTGLRYRYAHLDEKPQLKPGSVIPPGEVIGHTGNSGGSTGAHLHYEVLKNGIPQNPRGTDSVSTFSKGSGDLFSSNAVPDKNRRPGTTKPPAAPVPTPSKPAPQTPPRQDTTRPATRPSKPTRVPSSISPLHSIHDGG